MTESRSKPNSYTEKWSGHFSAFDTANLTYPDSQFFRPTFDSAKYNEAVNRSNETLIPKGLSLHVTFPHIHLAARNTPRQSPISGRSGTLSGYVQALQKEIILQSGCFDKDRRIQHLSFTDVDSYLLQDGSIEELVHLIESSFDLRRSSLCDLLVSLDASSTSLNDLDYFREMNFNQVVFNVNLPALTSGDKIQSLMRHSRSIGFQNLQVILISDPAYCPPERLDEQVHALLKLLPDCVAISFRPSLPNTTGALASEIDVFFGAWVHWLVATGYHYIGLGHFVRPDNPLTHAQKDGLLCLQPQGFGIQPSNDYIGIGVGAISQFQQCYSQNYHRLGDYCHSLAQMRFAVARGFELSIDDFLRRAVIERLLCFEFADLQEILEGANISNDDYFETECGVLAKAAKRGLVRLRGDQRVEITPEGRPLATQICQVFDRYRPVKVTF